MAVPVPSSAIQLDTLHLKLSHDFMPCAERARCIDLRMRQQLCQSLQYLRDTASEQLNMDLPGIKLVVDGMRQGLRYPASTFGLYYEITSALIDGNLEVAIALDDELSQETPFATNAIQVMTLDEVSRPSNRTRYQRLMDTDPTAPFRIVSPPANQGDKAKNLYADCLRKLEQVYPELHGEVSAILHDIILVEGDSSLDYKFAGGSCYMLWGALFINASMHQSPVSIMEAIAHESAHSLLFGFTIDEPLVNNADEDVFESPLRFDLRPMDGIYHATYVSARMHLAMSRMLHSELVSHEDQASARAAMLEDEINFQKGYATVSASGDLTVTGKSLLSSAHLYMTNTKVN